MFVTVAMVSTTFLYCKSGQLVCISSCNLVKNNLN